ncbi:quaternary amine ABC transporter ATP-binding protein [Acetobacter peroxydans]|jgi:glycine betaine/proline transport system ATP-binding protein|uniref:quaternary amine ABC transporter ATP-binding protein n=1 Tax=Acetobacter peroxydans TaxID=104098 RepID=UPI002351F7B4|nr:ATP-binding cassette domain-containing protein [Acetobacter peroxydans]MCH4144046.1 ATP-binding cassette domain-containing protein [Acetobacter peroxydans]MCI1394809.1 ATP-binding cassette domain-containing protein [Acetobacter peroxydans]MCI1412205.1 ATP-binding cassette domain-containing protein [Acetobacter peroxydans]MCI1439106.1 ATP-binding cassette domain-containing protein [Acetobacter peroxydans]MCI1567502.1 ATP-binding cassette domain-containing protein [Acetobacter peroxydans]
MNSALSFRHVDIMFPSRKGGGLVDKAIALAREGKSRAEILEATGVVLGVSDANLEVERGKISVLMGLSGSGKSTLLRAANRLNKTVNGEVLIGNGVAHVDVASCNEDTLRDLRKTRIAMVFQQFAILPWRTVRENVGLGLELRDIAPAIRREMVDEKLELVGLDKWADSNVKSLSGGMQQRVGLARAFATDADILLMDEPFSALDPLIRRKLQDELMMLQKKLKKTILFVSHDIDEAMKIGNQITIMKEGRIVQTGTPQEIVAHPANDYVRDFISHMNPLPILSADSFMKPLSHDLSDLTIAGSGPYRLDVASGRLVSADGRSFSTLFLASGEPSPQTLPQDCILCVPETTPLSEIAALSQQSPWPLLVHNGSAITGLCDERSIISAVVQVSRDAA